VIRVIVLKDMAKEQAIAEASRLLADEDSSG